MRQTNYAPAADSEEITAVRRVVPVTRAEIDVGAVRANLADLQAFVGPDVGVLAVMKANAYGHGALRTARALDRDVAGFVVTNVGEASDLRRAGVASEILLMAASFDGAHDTIVAAGLTPAVSRERDLVDLARAAKARRVKQRVHLDVDTGMSRLGARPETFDALVARASSLPEIVVTGVATHLSCADDPEGKTTDAQLDRFERACANVRAAGHRPTVLHTSSSASIVHHPRSRFRHVRSGIALFGGDEPSGIALRPAMRVVSHVAQVRTIDAGDRVSYGGRWRATRRTRVATIPVGYAHGYPRRLEGRAHVLVGGRRCPVIGAICMEMTMVDVTDVDAAEGAEVVLVGAQGTERITAGELAKAIDGIVEELFCGLSTALPRAYVGTEP